MRIENQESVVDKRAISSRECGRGVDAWTLRGAGGMVAEVLNYGAVVSRLLVPDRDGKLGDVTLGFSDPDQWMNDNGSFFGATAGRIAGRVPGGLLRFDGKEIQLECNEGENHLHGGVQGLDKRLWRAEPMAEDGGTVGLKLRYDSPDGEEGYPGRVEFLVTYKLTPENEFIFEWEAYADRPTPVSLAHHSYFNLGGESSALDHEITIFADEIVTTDERMTPLGEVKSVNGTAADLREPKRLGAIVDDLWQQHGDLYRLPEGGESELVARMTDAASGRTMDVRTTDDFLQFYTAAHFDGTVVGRDGLRYPKHAGICFECQGYPDCAAGLGDILVRPGEPRRSRTVYAFGIERKGGGDE